MSQSVRVLKLDFFLTCSCASPFTRDDVLQIAWVRSQNVISRDTCAISTFRLLQIRKLKSLHYPHALSGSKFLESEGKI